VLPLTFARERIKAFLREIERLKDSDFPYLEAKIGKDFREIRRWGVFRPVLTQPPTSGIPPAMNQTRDIPSQGHDSLRFQPERLHFARDADR
jgi:hypothetical protein